MRAPLLAGWQCWLRAGWRRGRWWLQCASYAYGCNYHRLHLLACVVGVGVGVRARSRACRGPAAVVGPGRGVRPSHERPDVCSDAWWFLDVALAVNVVMYIGSVFGWCWCWCWWVARCCAVLFCVMSCCVVLCCVFALALAWCVRASVVAAAVRVRARMCSRGGVRARAAVQRRPLAPLHEHRGAERARDRCARARAMCCDRGVVSTC